MTYWNPVDHYGVDAFARDLSSAGGSGLITPDLTPEESGAWPGAADKYGLDRGFLVPPSSPAERIAAITRLCRGLVFPARLIGINGTPDPRRGSAAALGRATPEP